MISRSFIPKIALFEEKMKKSFEVQQFSLSETSTPNVCKGPCTNHAATKGRGLKIFQNRLRHSSNSGYVRREGVKNWKKMATWFVHGHWSLSLAKVQPN